MRPDQPYNELPLLPPPFELETTRTLKAAIGAHKELASVRSAAARIPNPTILLSGLVLQEARTSSEIENIVTTNDALYEPIREKLDNDPGAKEILRYRQALWAGFEEIKRGTPFTPDLLSRLCSTVRGNDEGIRTGPGVRIATSRTGQPIYTPPVGRDVIERLLENLCEFLHAMDGTDPLIKMAIAHYQFEAIHPYTDGNGRTGRILCVLYLVQQGLLDQPVLYLSKFLLDRRAAYYSGLRLITEEQDWEPWILFMLEAVQSTAEDTAARMDRIRQALDETGAVAKRDMKKGYSPALIQLLFHQPYLRIAQLEAAGIARRDAASAYLRDLERIGILESHRRGRDVIYIHRRILSILSGP